MKDFHKNKNSSKLIRGFLSVFVLFKENLASSVAYLYLVSYYFDEVSNY